MAQRVPLRLGGRISSTTGLALGRIGAFAVSDDGRTFAVVARHVAFAEEDRRIFLNDQEIGKVEQSTVATKQEARRAPICDALVAIDVTADLRPIIIEEAGISVEHFCNDTLDLLDKRVRTISDSDIYASGIVAWVGSRVKVKHRDGSEVHYSDAIEVAFDENGGSGLAKGDAGMPIVTLDGALVGLAISGTSSRCFVAPIAPFLKQHRLQLYHPGSPQAGNESQVDKVTSGLRDVASNLSEWLAESKRLKPLFHRSSLGEVQIVLEGAE
jgi:hypothetical protein